jgi:hypothetical protein
MSEDRWYDKYDMTFLFPIEYEEEGLEWSCDEDNYCWTFNDETQVVCNLDGDCYDPEAALEVYFEGDWLIDLDDWENIDEEEWTEWTEDWMNEFDLEDPEWYRAIPEDFDFSLVFMYESADEYGITWECDEDVSTGNEDVMCVPCTDYAAFIGAGEGQYKQDDDGKCWSTNEAGTSNGLHLCTEISDLSTDDELEMCEPCTDYAMWVDPGQGTYK